MIAKVKNWAPNHSAPSKHLTIFNFNNFVAAQEELPPFTLTPAFRHSFVSFAQPQTSIATPMRDIVGSSTFDLCFCFGPSFKYAINSRWLCMYRSSTLYKSPQTKLSVFNSENVSAISSLSHLNVDLMVRFQILSTLSCEINFVNSKFYAHETVRSVSHAPTR